MSKHRRSRFKLVEVDGWSETELYEAESLEELTEFLEQKGGNP
ncbi:MAG: hypothetical protein HQRvContig03_26 [Haloquadratum phage sp.]|nr:hypothetical protein [Halorubrum ezzemoulense]MDB2226149.1 hypothetical protein [Halorubrum ezzemoulense]UXF50968.1 MAG: hypothetical protein HQRvContig03_26 [Haloquadratum phage sp.]